MGTIGENVVITIGEKYSFFIYIEMFQNRSRIQYNYIKISLYILTMNQKSMSQFWKCNKQNQNACSEQSIFILNLRWLKNEKSMVLKIDFKWNNINKKRVIFHYTCLSVTRFNKYHITQIIKILYS